MNMHLMNGSEWNVRFHLKPDQCMDLEVAIQFSKFLCFYCCFCQTHKQPVIPKISLNTAGSDHLSKLTLRLHCMNQYWLYIVGKILRARV